MKHSSRDETLCCEAGWQKAAKKVERWQQIAESAAKQSKRMLIPNVHQVLSFKEMH